jgi:hypothetical protein
MMNVLQQKIAALRSGDKADIMPLDTPAPNSTQGLEPEDDFGDNNQDDGDNTTIDNNQRGLVLKVIGTPQLIKTAGQLFALVKEDSEDHSLYAKFLLDLDALLRKYGAQTSLGQNVSPDNLQGQNDGGEGDQDLGDPDKWR